MAAAREALVWQGRSLTSKGVTSAVKASATTMVMSQIDIHFELRGSMTHELCCMP